MANSQKGGGGGGYTINPEIFTERLKVLYSHWKDNKEELWGSSDAIVIATPPASEDFRYLKSSALNLWMLGLEFPKTIIVFMKDQVHFLCSQKKASLLGVLKKPIKESIGAETVMHVKARNDNGSALMDGVFEAVRSQSNAAIVGYIAKEAPEGNLLGTWDEKLKNSGLKLVDVTNGFSDLLAVKDNSEVMNVKKAAYLTSAVMKLFVVPKLERIIDEENKVSHFELTMDTEKTIMEPAIVKVKLKKENVDICYPPIFQSEGVFDLRPSALSTEEKVHYDSKSVIICAMGSRYNSYCSNLARTFFIDANEVQSKAYEVLLKAHEAAIAALKPGNKVSGAYLAAFSVVEKDGPEFAANLTKTAGTGIGLEFRESGLRLNANNDRVVKAGMVFNVCLGFQNLQAPTKNPKTDQFSLLLADTVVVGEQVPDVITSLSSKLVKDVAY